MWPNTRIVKRLKIALPIIQAPMAGGVTTPELIASISNQGALGSLGAGYMSPEQIHQTIQAIRSLTDKPFAVNLFIPADFSASKQQIKTMKTLLAEIYPGDHVAKEPFVYPFAEQIQAVIEAKVPAFSFTFGVPEDKWLTKLRRNKTILLGTATTVAEALFLEKKKIDFIIAQGFEAGGHRGSFLENPESSLIGNFALIPAMKDHISIPVIASGSIMDERGIVAALFLGAEGVQMGTAFMSCREAGTHREFKKLLLNKKLHKTVLTRVLTGRLARGINNEFIEELNCYAEKILPYPVQHALTAAVRAEASKKNDLQYMSLFVGQAAYLNQGMTASKLIKQLDKNVRKLLQRNGK
jgi:nitronate monooxygenase